jgi:hypothetical protein
MKRPRVTSFTPRDTSRVLKFAVVGCTGALINAIEFTANYAFSMSWARGVYRGHVREEVESLEEVIDGAA